jgi:hypothetical protein
MPRKAVHVACGGVAIRNPLRIGPRDTHTSSCVQQASRRKTALDHPLVDQRRNLPVRHAALAIRNPVRIGPARRKILLLADLHSKWERYSDGTPPGDTQSSAHRPWGTRKIAGRPPEGPRPTLVFPPLVLRCSSGGPVRSRGSGPPKPVRLKARCSRP